MVSEVEFNRPSLINGMRMAAMGVFSRVARRLLGVPVEKSFEITCQAFLVSVASSAPSGVFITESQ